MAKLTAVQCRARAQCLLEAAEHLTVAWSDENQEVLQVDWAYKWLQRQADKWEVRADVCAQSDTKAGT